MAKTLGGEGESDVKQPDRGGVITLSLQRKEKKNLFVGIKRAIEVEFTGQKEGNIPSYVVLLLLRRGGEKACPFGSKGNRSPSGKEERAWR